jgi:thioredoxin reductase/bacterioferritin-associated ferredoxin
MMERQTDLVIVGAGPAGLAAACSASNCGLEVTLVDEQSSPGGQLFRNIESPLGQASLDAKERAAGMALAQEFRESGVNYNPDTIVWGLEPRRVFGTTHGHTKIFQTQSIIVAPGAMERPVPFPGWTLPGVMGAGGADILLRAGGSLLKNPSEPIVLAGNGPLLLLLACHLIDRGVKIAAWLDTGYWSKRFVSGIPMSVSFLDSAYMGKGLSMALKIAKAKIPFVLGVKNIQAIGDTRVTKVSYEVRGKVREIETNCLLRHEGVIPRTQILNSMGAKHLWDPVQRYWYPDVTECGATTIDGVYLAGDAGYVHGGDASIIKGTLAGIDAARHLGVITKSEAAFRSKESLKKLRLTRFARGFLRYVFAPNPNIFDVPDNTTVCRCESVTAGEIRQVVLEGNSDVNEVKLYSRCGMGPCQGRMCGSALAEITASTLSTSPKNVGSLQVRQPFRPVSLENYCDLTTGQ